MPKMLGPPTLPLSQTKPSEDLHGSAAPLEKLLARTGGLLSFSVGSNLTDSAAPYAEEEEAAAYMHEMRK